MGSTLGLRAPIKPSEEVARDRIARSSTGIVRFDYLSSESRKGQGHTVNLHGTRNARRLVRKDTQTEKKGRNSLYISLERRAAKLRGDSGKIPASTRPAGDGSADLKPRESAFLEEAD